MKLSYSTQWEQYLTQEIVDEMVQIIQTMRLLNSVHDIVWLLVNMLEHHALGLRYAYNYSEMYTAIILKFSCYLDPLPHPLTPPAFLWSANTFCC